MCMCAGHRRPSVHLLWRPTPSVHLRQTSGDAIMLPGRQCVVNVRLPRRCHRIAMPFVLRHGHAIAMPWPCRGYNIATTLPCHGHVVATTTMTTITTTWWTNLHMGIPVRPPAISPSFAFRVGHPPVCESRGPQSAKVYHML